MFDPVLAKAVARFVQAAQNASEADLDREWAWGAYDSEGVRFAFFRTYEELRELAIKTAGVRAARRTRFSSVQRALAQYHAAYRDLQALWLGIDPDQENLAPAEKEWTTRQIVAHIVGADMGFFGVVKYALERFRTADNRPAEIPDAAWDEMLSVNEDSYRALMESPLAELVSYHQGLHERVLTEFADISDAELAVPSLYWEGYELGLRFRLHRFDSHMRQHSIQIEKTLPAIGCSPTEVRRLARLLYAALTETEGVTIGAWDLCRVVA